MRTANARCEAFARPGGTVFFSADADNLHIAWRAKARIDKESFVSGDSSLEITAKKLVAVYLEEVDDCHGWRGK